MALMQKGHHAPVWVTGSVLSKSSTGNWQIVITFRNEAGETIDGYLATSTAAREYTEQKLLAVGYDLNAHDNDILPLNAGAESPIVGNETEIDVIEDSYNGKKTLKVGRIGSGFRQQAPASEAELAAAEFRKLCVAAKGPAARPAAKPAPRSSSVPW